MNISQWCFEQFLLQLGQQFQSPHLSNTGLAHAGIHWGEIPVLQVDNLTLEPGLAHIVPDLISLKQSVLMTIPLSISIAHRLEDCYFHVAFPPWLKASCRSFALHFLSVTIAKITHKNST